MELYEAVADARIRLRAVEEEYERGLEAGSAVLRITGREYASAVHKYSNAVMAWLKWFDIYGKVGVVWSAKTSSGLSKEVHANWGTKA